MMTRAEEGEENYEDEGKKMKEKREERRSSEGREK